MLTQIFYCGNYFTTGLTIVNFKVYCIKRLIFWPVKTRIMFFKAFIMPHFDYCSSLFVYFYILCCLRWISCPIDTGCSIGFRFSVFKIMNEFYLENIKARVCHLSNKNIRPQRTASLNKYIQKNIMDVISTRTKSGEHSLSFFLVSFINLVIKDSFLLEITVYKKFISTNFSNLFDSFNQLFKNEH